MAEVEMIIDSVRRSPVNHQWVVVLKGKLAEQYLPVWIGSPQAEVIKRELTQVRPFKTFADDPISKDIKRIGSKIKSVKLDKLEGNKFSAELLLTDEGKSCEISCPPAKALAIAVRARVPIFADEIILDRAAISVPAAMSGKP